MARSAAARAVRAELDALWNPYDLDEPPPHEQIRILIEIARLRARKHAEYQAGMHRAMSYVRAQRLASYLQDKWD